MEISNYNKHNKKRKSRRKQNPNQFFLDESLSVTKAHKLHQKQQHMTFKRISSKILKEAFVQQKEIQEERRSSFSGLFSADGADKEEFDDFQGFDDIQNCFRDNDEIDENDEKVLAAFFSTDARPQLTLADVITAKIRECGSAPKLDESVVELYKGLGEFLSKYTAGKMPKVFKNIPSMADWEYVLHLTEPEKWSPNAMYRSTIIFASNLNSEKATRFYKLVLLPRIRNDIRKHKRLHFSLSQSTRKALYKPDAFIKGILLPLCQSGTCSLREAVILGSILQNVSIPVEKASAAIVMLLEMEYRGTTSYFIKILFEKKYALKIEVVKAAVAHFMRFLEDTKTMPVIWHQSLLAFVQKYKNALQKADKDNLITLVCKQKHALITPEILRELESSLDHEEDPMLTKSLASVSSNTIEEDRFDIPDVPMEDD